MLDTKKQMTYSLRDCIMGGEVFEMKIKMIAIDLDSTLLQSDKSISEYTARILHNCQQEGILVAFATARSEHSCGRFIDLIKPNAVVSNGGALVRVQDKIIYRATMNRDIANKLLLSCLKQPSVGYITVDTDNGYFINKHVDINNSVWAEYLPAFYADLENGLDCDAYKITVEISDNKTAYEIMADFPTVDVIRYAGERWYRFADKAADKWNGVKALADYSGIEVSEIAAFGDDYNDVEMLRRCGVGVAMANAIDDVKAVADYICDTNNNDGVAKWLDDKVLRVSEAGA